MDTQNYRRFTRSAFFTLFLLAPVLDIFRLDLNQGHFILLGLDWTLGVDPGTQADAMGLAAQVMLRVFLPGMALLAAGIWLVWRYGRLYCGWLCPHFSVVEGLDALMQRCLGRRSVWERLRGEGRGRAAAGRVTFATACLAVAFLWALTLLTYLVTPSQVYTGLAALELPRWQGIFLTAATTVFAVDFVLARHFFCKYGCAVGVFQSLIWMGNPRGLVVRFDAHRARDCRDCNACDLACPMRLPPRGMKRAKFTCTQCLECVSACADVQRDNPRGPLLHWVAGEAARAVDRQPRQGPATPRVVRPAEL